MVLVPDGEFASEHVDGLDSYGSLDFLHLESTWMRHQVWTNDTVATHLGIFVGLVVIEITAEVAAISPILLAFLIRCQQRLIVPIPDAASLEARERIYHIPKFEEIA